MLIINLLRTLKIIDINWIRNTTTISESTISGIEGNI